MEQLHAQPFPVPRTMSPVAARPVAPWARRMITTSTPGEVTAMVGSCSAGPSVNVQAWRNGVNGSGVQPQLMRKKQYLLIKSRRKFSGHVFMIVTPIVSRETRSRLHSQGQVGFLPDQIVEQVEQVPVVNFWNQINGSGYRSPELQQR